MSFKDVIKSLEKMVAGFNANAFLSDKMEIGRASARISHKRPYDFDEKRGIYLYKEVDEPEVVWNVKTNVGIVQAHAQVYGTAGLLTCGFNYIALSNDALTETSASTTLSNEIVANGLARVQGTVTLPTGSGTVTTVSKVFTCATAPQAAQKTALFTAVAAGVMNHALAFTQRSLQIADTLTIDYSLTIS